jgi:hypothetical protein
MVGGFILYWPVGLAVLAYILWSQSMGRQNGHWIDRAKAALGIASGNSAFEAHKASVLRGLEARRQKLVEEERQFALHMDRVRMAKDKAAFDDFIKRRPV